MASLAVAALLTAGPGHAQTPVPESSLKAGAAPESVVSIDSAPRQRGTPRPRRLGDSLNVDDAQEWSPDITARARSGSRSSQLENEIGLAQQALERGLIVQPGVGALARFRAVLALDPGNATALNGIADGIDTLADQVRLAYEAGDAEGVAAGLSDLRANAPDHPAIIDISTQLLRDNQLASLLLSAAEATEAGFLTGADSAHSYYQQTLQLDPNNVAATAGIEGLERLLLARAAEQTAGQAFAAARQLLTQAMSLRGDPEEHVVAQQVANDGAERQMFNQRRQGLDQLLAEGRFEQARQEYSQLLERGYPEPLTSIRNAIERGENLLALTPGSQLRDTLGEVPGGFDVSQPVVVPRGRFVMGSPAEETGRAEREGPQQTISLPLPFAMLPTEVTVGQFRAFVQDTGYVTDAERLGGSSIFDERSGSVVSSDEANWRQDFSGRPAKSNAPVIHVSWYDARAYADWLSQRSGQIYRLPSEAEFEYALRAGSTSVYWWGDERPRRRVENLTGERDQLGSLRWPDPFQRYGDGHWGPAPVASFDANPFQLHDLGGNVSEWVADCYHSDLSRVAEDGGAMTSDQCAQRVVRGASWASAPLAARSASRAAAGPASASCLLGFRLVREL